MNVHDTTRYRLEAVEILAHYQAVRNPLALRFLAALEEAHARAVSTPLAHREHRDGVRVVLLRRFPYRLRFQLSLETAVGRRSIAQDVETNGARGIPRCTRWVH
ncbi:MAG: hypothetical protein WC205_09520 [Opitutaceae bacterium]